MRNAHYVPCCRRQEDKNHHAHACRQRGVDPRRSTDSEQVQAAKQHDKQNHPDRVGNFRQKIQRELAAQDGAYDRIQHVIHCHAPSRHIAKGGMNF